MPSIGTAETELHRMHTVSEPLSQQHSALESLAFRPSIKDSLSLKAAFEMFNQVSIQLTDSYQFLESKVAELTDELERVRKQREFELVNRQRVTHRLESLLKLLPAGVIVLDQNGLIRDCNPAAEELLGESLHGKLWLDIIGRCFAPRVDDGHEISLKDGRRVNIATRSLEEEPGQIILLNDLTHTRQLQEQLSRQQRLTAMGKMMAALAHQIRTPLSAAMLYCGHLTEGNLDQEQVQKFSSKVLARLNHLEQQVRDMLVFAKGDIKLTEVVSVSELCAEIKAAIEISLSTHDASCDFLINCHDEQVLCNKPTIVGAIANLVNNALQAVGHGAQIRIEINKLEDFIKIAVIDYGPGMSAATIEQIENAFFTTKPQGTGLGIAVARSVVRAHRGELTIRSDEGEGTTVIIELPCMKKSCREGDDL